MFKLCFKTKNYWNTHRTVLFFLLISALFFILPNNAQAILCGAGWEVHEVDMTSIYVSGNYLIIAGMLENGYCAQACSPPDGFWAVGDPLGELQYQIDPNTSDPDWDTVNWIDLTNGPLFSTGQWTIFSSATPTNCTEAGPFVSAYQSSVYQFDTGVNRIPLSGTQLNPGVHDFYLRRFFDITQHGYDVFQYTIPSADFEFTVSVNPVSGVSRAGASVTSQVTVTRVSGTAGAVGLSATLLPAGPTASFSPSSCTPNNACTSTMTINPNGAANGLYTITISGTSGSTVRYTTYNLLISNNPVDLLIRRGGTTDLFSDGPITINSGNSAELQWFTTGVSSCTATSSPLNA